MPTPQESPEYPCPCGQAFQSTFVFKTLTQKGYSHDFHSTKGLRYKPWALVR